ncbi:hypothetical protein P691DRAFT_790556 [Macrolepiota fuliginosa MF-IS2]|uniref:Uncharacterized protein n=1 Tax=Macrolepiota fuliginosa MF-IS2 TaxID=1400762 RepID=A0A9P6BWF7_9AGAR|nr:hypothetical protein P691DRAFT_790556 [Macrolepiota fuliginosa MF-IS2]
MSRLPRLHSSSPITAGTDVYFRQMRQIPAAIATHDSLKHKARDFGERLCDGSFYPLPPPPPLPPLAVQKTSPPPQHKSLFEMHPKPQNKSLPHPSLSLQQPKNSVKSTPSMRPRLLPWCNSTRGVRGNLTVSTEPDEYNVCISAYGQTGSQRSLITGGAQWRKMGRFPSFVREGLIGCYGSTCGRAGVLHLSRDEI